MMLEEAKTASKMSLSKGSSGSEFYVDDNLYFTSIGSTDSRLYSNLKGEYFVEKCLQARFAKSTPSIKDGQFSRFPSNTLTIDLYCSFLSFS